MAQVTDTENPTRVADLEVVPSDEGYIIYEQDKDRVHYLNAVAALIYELCSGEISVAEITELVREAFGLESGPEAEVNEAIAKMKLEGLLR